MTLGDLFSSQHLLEIRLCFTQASIADFYRCTFVSQDQANKVAPVFTKSPQGFCSSTAHARAYFLYFQAQCQPSVLFYPTSLSLFFFLSLHVPPFPFFFTFNLISCCHFLLPFPPFSSGHCHCMIDVDAAQIERLCWGTGDGGGGGGGLGGMDQDSQLKYEHFGRRRWSEGRREKM